ncbi:MULTISPECIES: LysO family transporter [unclassified Fusibacter]|uniref:LysO family transporter n=1 Tax=unclassified Fusibacter TaxID=2624464 RepID=UPI001011128E|nr:MULTISPECIES: LysO family transporter [unclassified Fusibacter]MCK8061369.1 LysO family transporter [Fusibacter sp. A2]NPE23588.1 LysO family transporter [Fusibacter sp. A1]RXV58997.1 DUF340 domain-containing protein [Fusibacter sp. A1]
MSPLSILSSMLPILGSLVLGIIVGTRVPKESGFLKLNGKLQHFGVLALIFTMGIAIGLDDEIFKNISAIGYQALLYAVITVVLSIFMVQLFTRLLLKREVKHD